MDECQLEATNHRFQRKPGNMWTFLSDGPPRLYGPHRLYLSQETNGRTLSRILKPVIVSVQLEVIIEWRFLRLN